MNISKKDWNNYINKLSKLCTTAGEQMKAFVEKNGLDNRNALIDYAYALVNKYGEGSAELACQMYDAIAELQNASVDPAEPAEMPTIGEVAKAVNGTLKQSPDGKLIDAAVQRLVKRSGADTTLKNAIRDKAQFAWIPSGDTCAFCITLASRGWQNASQNALKNGHAEHIHSHCDCQYAIRFNENMNVKGYDPDKYRAMYNSFEGKPQDKINAMRRALNEKNKQLVRIPQFPASSVSEKVKNGEYSLKLSQQQYDKHIEGTKTYSTYKKARIDKGLSPQSKLSVSYEEAQNIIEKYSGTGIIRSDRKGNPLNVEDISCDSIIGEYMQKGEWIKTNKAALHHSKNGTHIVPIKGSTYD